MNRKNYLKILLMISPLLAIVILALLIKKFFLPTPYETQKTIEITNAQLEQTTGVEFNPKPLETPTPAQEHRAILIEFCPINEKNFSIDFSFKQNKFIIELKPPTKENYKKFMDWFQNSGFEDIPPENFVFSNYQP